MTKSPNINRTKLWTLINSEQVIIDTNNFRQLLKNQIIESFFDKMRQLSILYQIKTFEKWFIIGTQVITKRTYDFHLGSQKDKTQIVSTCDPY